MGRARESQLAGVFEKDDVEDTLVSHAPSAFPDATVVIERWHPESSPVLVRAT